MHLLGMIEVSEVLQAFDHKPMHWMDRNVDMIMVLFEKFEVIRIHPLRMMSVQFNGDLSCGSS